MKLMAYLDGELEVSERESLRLHLLECPGCSRLMESQRRLEAAWRDSWRDPPDSRFKAMRESVDRRLRKPRGIPGWLIGAAAGAGAVFLGVRVFLGPGRGRLEDRIHAEPPVPAVAGERPEEAFFGGAPADGPYAEPSSAAMGTAEPEEAGVSAGLGPSSPVTDGAGASEAEGAKIVSGPDSPDGSSPGLLYHRPSHAPALEPEEAEETLLLGQAADGEMGVSPAPRAVMAVQDAEPSGALCEAVAVTGTLSRENREPVRAAPSFTLSCTGPGGAEVRPWEGLTSFVQGLLDSLGRTPSEFRLDSLGYTVEQDGVPRTYLGVDDLAMVPMTVRVTAF